MKKPETSEVDSAVMGILQRATVTFMYFLSISRQKKYRNIYSEKMMVTGHFITNEVFHVTVTLSVTLL